MAGPSVGSWTLGAIFRSANGTEAFWWYQEPYGLPTPPNSTTASAEQILKKYVQALSGSQRLDVVTGFYAKGTYEAYEKEMLPVEIFAKSSAQRTTIVHTLDGDGTTTYDGQSAWSATPETLKRRGA